MVLHEIITEATRIKRAFRYIDAYSPQDQIYLFTLFDVLHKFYRKISTGPLPGFWSQFLWFFSRSDQLYNLRTAYTLTKPRGRPTIFPRPGAKVFPFDEPLKLIGSMDVKQVIKLLIEHVDWEERLNKLRAELESPNRGQELPTSERTEELSTSEKTEELAPVEEVQGLEEGTQASTIQGDSATVSVEG